MLTLHYVIARMDSENDSDLSMQYRTHHYKQRYRRILEFCRPDMKDAMIFIYNTYGLIKLPNFVSNK